MAELRRMTLELADVRRALDDAGYGGCDLVTGVKKLSQAATAAGSPSRVDDLVAAVEGATGKCAAERVLEKLASAIAVCTGMNDDVYVYPSDSQEEAELFRLVHDSHNGKRELGLHFACTNKGWDAKYSFARFSGVQKWRAMYLPTK